MAVGSKASLSKKQSDMGVKAMDIDMDLPSRKQNQIIPKGLLVRTQVQNITQKQSEDKLKKKKNNSCNPV